VRCAGVSAASMVSRRVRMRWARMVSLSPIVAAVVVDDVGQLCAGRLGRVEQVLVPERNAREPQEGEHFQAVAVVVRDAEQHRVGVEGEHHRRRVASAEVPRCWR